MKSGKQEGDVFVEKAGNGIARTGPFPSATWERGKELFRFQERGVAVRGRQDQISRFFQITKLCKADGIMELLRRAVTDFFEDRLNVIWR
jgi:hypothetical protein